MARTPLFDRLRRCLLLADRAEREGIGTSEIVERRAAGIARRDLLKSAGGIALGLGATRVLTACGVPVEGDAPPGGAEGAAATDIQSALKTDARIVVVGAGLAGLACAYRLAKRGVDARVFDANDRVGGRTFTLRSPKFASKVELGGELIDTGHTQIQALATELGLTLLDQAGAVASLEVERYFLGNQRYTEAQIIELFRPVARILRADWRSLGRPKFATYSDFTPAARALDLLSIEQWLDKNGISGPIRTLLDIGYTAEYGLEIAQQSYLNLLYLISRDPEPFLLYGASDEKYTIEEGNDALTTRMAAALKSPVHLGHRLESVREKADGTLQVVFAKQGGTVEVIADKLVLAMPFNQLRKCDLRFPIGAAKRKSLKNVAYGTNAKVMVGTSSRPWYAAGSSGTSFNDRVFQESWETSRGYPGPGGVLTNFSGGRFGMEMAAGSALFQGKRFLDRLDVVYPGVRAAFTGEAVRMHWPTAKHFEGSYACYGPGDWTTFVGSEAEVEGNVHFCGEHTSTDFQGYMEGAVESGERVAKEIRKALKMPEAA
ncbi:MAG: FAD-dependent oxidoreductase [Deltaproteobacteria bacterium]|nr:FAD-dependent oxidoreductase [Deltaproteobacteria bacterium]